MTSRTGSPTLAVALAAATLLLATACTTGGQSPTNTMSANPQQQFQDLLTRPDIDQISQHYEQMRDAIRDQLVADFKMKPWAEDSKTGGRAGCRNYPDVSVPDAQSRTLPIWYSESALPDEEWPHAAQIANAITSQYGFSKPSIVVDTPGNHEISAKDNYGAEIIFGTKSTTVLTLLTGCHLTPEAHQRGTPSDR